MHEFADSLVVMLLMVLAGVILGSGLVALDRHLNRP